MGLPFYAESIELMYRKDLFDAAGLEAPQTMDELMAAAAALHDPENGITGISLRGDRGAGLNVYIWTSFLRAFGGTYFDEDMKPVLDSPEAIAAAEFYAEILQNYGFPGPANVGWEATLTNMQQGNVAMIIDATVFGGPVSHQKTRLWLEMLAMQWFPLAQPAVHLRSRRGACSFHAIPRTRKPPGSLSSGPPARTFNCVVLYSGRAAMSRVRQCGKAPNSSS